jgi:hypothetical protein
MRIVFWAKCHYLHYSLLFLLYTNKLSTEVIETNHIILNAE